MNLSPGHRSLYAAFDSFPSAKGAAARIGRVAPALFEAMGGGVLYCLGNQELPAYQREGPGGSIEILRFREAVPNLLERALCFGEHLERLLAEGLPALEICQFRDPWAGVPLLSHRRRRYRAVYEINGLPSVELPARYRELPAATLEKLRAAEVYCWSEADCVITPSATMGANLARLGVPERKIEIVPNGADLAAGSDQSARFDRPDGSDRRPALPPRPEGAPGRYLLYFGGLQSWQGVDVLVRAFALLADLTDLGLVICASLRSRSAAHLASLAERLEVASRVVWRFALPQAELGAWLAHAALSVAPLTECPRNCLQGCFPLKVLESMAAGVPVVASDLPVMRELICDGVEGRLVRPDRPSELARACRVLLEYPAELKAMGERSRRRVERNLTWDVARSRLRTIYGAFSAAGGDSEGRKGELRRDGWQALAPQAATAQVPGGAPDHSPRGAPDHLPAFMEEVRGA